MRTVDSLNRTYEELKPVELLPLEWGKCVLIVPMRN